MKIHSPIGKMSASLNSTDKGPGRPKLSTTSETERVAFCAPTAFLKDLRKQAAKKDITFSELIRLRLFGGAASHGKSA